MAFWIFFFVLTLLQIVFIVQCFLAFTNVNTLPMFQMGRFYFKFKNIEAKSWAFEHNCFIYPSALFGPSSFNYKNLLSKLYIFFPHL